MWGRQMDGKETGAQTERRNTVSRIAKRTSFVVTPKFTVICMIRWEREGEEGLEREVTAFTKQKEENRAIKEQTTLKDRSIQCGGYRKKDIRCFRAETHVRRCQQSTTCNCGDDESLRQRV